MESTSSTINNNSSDNKNNHEITSYTSREDLRIIGVLRWGTNQDGLELAQVMLHILEGAQEMLLHSQRSDLIGHRSEEIVELTIRKYRTRFLVDRGVSDVGRMEGL